MTDPELNIIPPSNNPESNTDQHRSLADRLSIPPFAFGFISLILVFLLYQIGGGLLTFIVTGTGMITRENVGTMRLLTFIGQICFILLPTLFLARLFSVRTSEVFPFRTPGIPESLFAFIALFSLQRVFEAYLFFQGYLPVPEELQTLFEPLKRVFEELTKTMIHAESPAELLIVIFVVAVMPALVEELFFRGFIQSVFGRFLSPAAAAVLAGTIFGLFHMNPFEIIPLIGLGIFFGILRHRSRSLWMPISMHFINNLFAVLVVYFGFQDGSLPSAGASLDELPVMIFIFIIFSGFFYFSFTAYLRTTHVSPYQGNQEQH